MDIYQNPQILAILPIAFGASLFLLGLGSGGDSSSSYKRAREQELKQQAKVYSRWDTLGKRLDRVVNAYCQMSPKSAEKTAQYHRIVSKISQELDAPTRFVTETLVPKYNLLQRIGLLQGALN